MTSPGNDTYPTTIGVMALFTVVLEFDGGTHISQFHARSANHAPSNMQLIWSLSRK
jgi:hypothetical protein